MSEFKGKNAYEIRTDILGLAKDITFGAFYSKYETDKAVASPTAEDVVAAARVLYEFVNQNTSK